MVRRLRQHAVPMPRAAAVSPHTTQRHSHAETDGEGARKTEVIWPVWVQRCGVGSSCGDAPQDQLAGVQRDIQHATSSGGAASQPGGQLAYELAHVIPRDGVADAATGDPDHAGPDQRRHGAAEVTNHPPTGRSAVQRHPSPPVWPA
jgi:hypothetical protein